MQCPRCRRENTQGSQFCAFCGAPLPAPAPAAPEAGAQATSEALALQVAALRGEVQHLAGAVAAMHSRLAALEGRATDPTAALSPALPPPQRAETAASAQPVPAVASEVAATAEAASGPNVTVWAPPVEAQSSGETSGLTALRERGWVEWEQVFGGNWLARIGVVALLIGVAFFLKLSFDNNWIGPVTRVSLGGAGSALLLGAGGYWRKRYPVYSQALMGGAVALAYLSTFAAFANYGLIGFYPAVALLFIVSAGSAAMALWTDSMALAIMGIIGAYGGPFILDGFSKSASGLAGAGPTVELPAYLMAVTVGILALASARTWRWLTWLAFLGTVATFQAWIEAFGGEATLLTKQGSLTVLFLLFVGATSLPPLLRRSAPTESDLALTLLNAAWFLGMTYGLMWSQFRDWLGGVTLLTALLYGGISYAALRRSPDAPYSRAGALGVGLLFITIAVPVQFRDTVWTTLVWNGEALALLVLSLRFSSPLVRASAYAVFIGVAVRLLAFETVLEPGPFQFIANERFGVFAVSVAVLYAGAYALWRRRARLTEWERKAVSVYPVLLVAASFFTVWALSFDLADEFNRTGRDNLKHLALTGVWSLYDVLAIAAGIRYRAIHYRALGYLLMALVAVWLLLFATRMDLGAFWPVLNERTLAFALGIASGYLTTYLLWRYHDRLSALEQRAWSLYPVSIVRAGFLTLWAVSTDLVTYFDGPGQENARNLSLTAFWAVYAVGVLVIGIVKRSNTTRLAALALLAAPVAKVFVYDVFALERIYRVVAFVGLGVLLLAGGYGYQRYAKAIRGFLTEKP
jgi:uncharacterized membrane protein